MADKQELSSIGIFSWWYHAIPASLFFPEAIGSLYFSISKFSFLFIIKWLR